MNKIVGISAGRKGKISEQAVKTVLEATEKPYDFYSLSEYNLVTCEACNGCVKIDQCVKNDGINEILDDMKEAQAIVFGAPEYWDGMNAKGRAFWERICFSTRHNDYFPLKNKKGVIIGVSGDGDSSGVLKDLRTFYNDAQIELVDEIEIQGEYACFTCGYGDRCEVGGLANLYDLPVDISKEKIPGLCNQHPEEGNGKNIINKLKKAGEKLI